MANPNVLISTPVTQVAKGGLLAVATLLPEGDPHIVYAGFEYIPEACGPALVDVDRCNPPTDSLSVEVSTAREASLTVGEAPFEEVLTVDWGDESVDSTGSNSTVDPVGPATFTHTYAAGGTYTITVTGATFGTRTVTIVVASGEYTRFSDLDKRFERSGLITATPFTVYKGVECDMVTTSGDEERARRGLLLGESRAIEAVVLDRLLSHPDTDTIVGGALTPKAALGALEGYAGDAYGGVATIHVPRSVVPFLEDLEVSLDGTLTTKQGTKIANGAGYSANIGPDGTEADAGEAWMYISGEVLIARSAVNVKQARHLPTNTAQALAERVVTAAVECFVAAVRVSLGGA